MPWTAKQHRFFALCSTPAGRRKAKGRCPSLEEARRMMREGVKRPASKKH